MGFTIYVNSLARYASLQTQTVVSHCAYKCLQCETMTTAYCIGSVLKLLWTHAQPEKQGLTELGSTQGFGICGKVSVHAD